MAKLTAEQLRKMVQEEVGKFGKMRDVADVAKDTEEYEAGEDQDHLAKHVNMLKVLKIEEGKLKARLAKIQEQKAKLARLISK